MIEVRLQGISWSADRRMLYINNEDGEMLSAIVLSKVDGVQLDKSGMPGIIVSGEVAALITDALVEDVAGQLGSALKTAHTLRTI